MANRNREVVTLQVGHFANYVGTHWWNLQESTFTYHPSEVTEPKEVDHDVLFREGQNLMGEVTYTPRLISIDLKGALNTLKQDGSLYDVIGQDDVQWDSDVTLHKLDIASKNEFLKDLEEYDKLEYTDSRYEEREADRDESATEQREEKMSPQKKMYMLDDSVSVWSDYLHLHLHPKSVYLVEEYQHKNDLQRFDMYGYGKQVMTSERERDELEDKVHYFLEECDHLQGMHMLVDIHDGFAGLGTSLMQQVQDDYSTKGFTVFGFWPPSFLHDTPTDQAIRILNSVMSYDGLSANSSAFIPLSTKTSMWNKAAGSAEFPYLNYKPELWYHSSAILGASIDTMTLPYRLSSHPSLMSHMTDALTAGGRKILGLQTTFPYPIGVQDTLVSSMMALDPILPWSPITSMFDQLTHPYAQSVVLRGVKPNRLKGIVNENMPGEIRAAETAEDILQLYIRDKCTNSLSAGCVIQQSLKVSAPFPHIFSSKVNSTGNIDTADRDPNIPVESVPMMTSLQASISTIAHINDLLSQASKLNVKKYSTFLQSGIEEDDYNEAKHNLQSLTQVYRSDVEAMY